MNFSLCFIQSKSVRQMKNVHLVLFQFKIRGKLEFKIDCLCNEVHDEWYHLEKKMNAWKLKILFSSFLYAMIVHEDELISLNTPSKIYSQYCSALS